MWMRPYRIRYYNRIPGYAARRQMTPKRISKVAAISRNLNVNVTERVATPNGNFVCPTCHLDVKISDLIGKRGSIGCSNCVK